MYYELKHYLIRLENEQKEMSHLKNNYTYWLEKTIPLLKKTLEQLKIEPFKR